MARVKCFQGFLGQLLFVSNFLNQTLPSQWENFKLSWLPCLVPVRRLKLFLGGLRFLARAARIAFQHLQVCIFGGRLTSEGTPCVLLEASFCHPEWRAKS